MSRQVASWHTSRRGDLSTRDCGSLSARQRALTAFSFSFLFCLVTPCFALRLLDPPLISLVPPGSPDTPMPDPSRHDETHLKVLRLLEATPEINQRNLAVALGVSLGKANFCLQALLQKGLVKAENFRSNHNKLSYAYLLTPSGFSEKAALTSRFLKRKTQEYELLKSEIALLQKEHDAIQSQDANPSPPAFF